MSEMNDQNWAGKLDCRLSDLGTAASLLTRFSLKENWVDPTRLAASVWAFPIIGGILGTLAGILLSALIWLNFSLGIAAAITLGFLILLTGGLHEDGIADCADGLGGGSSKEKALEIMKDSRLGAYGALVLMLFLLTRWSALADLAVIAPVLSMMLVGVASRLPMVLVMTGMENARDTGLSKHVGRPLPSHATMALALTALASFTVLGWWGFLFLPLVMASCLPLVFFASRKIGGQTGDILGGAQQCAEVVAVALLTAIWI